MGLILKVEKFLFVVKCLFKKKLSNKINEIYDKRLTSLINEIHFMYLGIIILARHRLNSLDYYVVHWYMLALYTHGAEDSNPDKTDTFWMDKTRRLVTMVIVI